MNRRRMLVQGAAFVAALLAPIPWPWKWKETFQGYLKRTQPKRVLIVGDEKQAAQILMQIKEAAYSKLLWVFHAIGEQKLPKQSLLEHWTVIEVRDTLHFMKWIAPTVMFTYKDGRLWALELDKPGVSYYWE